ncbi:type II secretion system F family protein [Desertimonas flava]|uniref:type II secretion system F family protein n=1 Tax=Desertimonas flava TaxID=2064846 RepID=UPI001D0C7019|nr:type II secretion system F family protein [Desertimonas flava]
MALVVGVLAGAAAVGVLVIWSSYSPGRAAPVAADGAWREALVPLALGVVAGSIAIAGTGWIVAGVASGIGAYAAVRAARHPRLRPAAEQERIEALASWCEQLRDLLAADQGIVGTISATVRTCPAALRPQVTALSSRLARQRPATAIAQFADDVDDPSGDLVATVLLEATKRSSRTSELLSELASTIRDRAAMRLRVDAERAGHRSEARFVIGFSVIVVVAILLFGRDTEFLDAYDDATGQLVLLLVAGFFGGGGWWLSRLTRYERPARFLTFEPDSVGGGDS